MQRHFFTLVGVEPIKIDVGRVFFDFGENGFSSKFWSNFKGKVEKMD